jgi:O-antigen/teichoic acid export membrane protein
LARLVGWNIMGNAGNLLIGFLVSILLARWLGPSNRGLLALMISTSTLALTLTALGMPVGVVYFSARRERDGPSILGNCLVQAAVIGAILIPASLLFHSDIADAFGHGEGGLTWVLVAALVPLTFLDWTTHSQLQGTLRFGRFNVLLVLQRLTSALGVVLLVGAAGIGVTGAILATIASPLVMIAGALPPILRLGRPRVDIPLMRTMVRYGVKAQIGSILQLANGRLDVIILQLFRPLSQVGYYVVAQAIAELVAQLAGAFQWTNMAMVSRSEGTSEEELTSTVAVRHHALLSGLATIANAVFGSLVILVAYGSAFRPAVVPMLVLLPGVWMLGIGFVIQGDLGGRGRPGLASTLSGVAAAVTVVLDLALIPPFGVIGAAVASVVAYTTLGVSSLIMLHRVSGVPLRSLLVPTRADLRAYRSLAAQAMRAVRRQGRRDGASGRG